MEERSMEEKHKYPENYEDLMMHVISLDKQMQIMNRNILDLYMKIERYEKKKGECIKVMFTPKYK